MATLTALENKIKEDNNEEKDPPTYLAICMACSYSEFYGPSYKKNQFVEVQPKTNNVVFFEDIGGWSYDLSEWPDIISLNDYMDKYIKKGDGEWNKDEYKRNFTTLITEILGNKDKKEDMKEFFEKYIHKFIQYTYDSNFLKLFDNLYEIYVLAYKPHVRYTNIIEKFSPVFQYYIIKKEKTFLPTFIKINKDEKKTQLYPETGDIPLIRLSTCFFDIEQKDTIYILESNEFKKFNFYNDPTDLDKDFELFNILDIPPDANPPIPTNALDKLFEKFIKFKRGNKDFIIDILNIYHSVINYHTGDVAQKMIDLGVEPNEMTIVKDIGDFKLVYVKSENNLFYNKNNVYITFENFKKYTDSFTTKKIDKNLFREFNLEQIWKNDKELEDFNDDEQKKFLKKIRDLKNDLLLLNVRDFIKLIKIYIKMTQIFIWIILLFLEKNI